MALDPLAESITVQAENFKETGGTTFTYADNASGVRINGTYVDYWNADDYILIDFNVTTAGNYFATAFAGTTLDNREIKITIGTESVTVVLPNNNDWTTTVETVIPGHFSLSAGTHTMKIEAVGKQEWQFNVDKVVLTEGTGVDPDVTVGVDSEQAGELSVYPNPANDILYISAGAQVNYIVFNAMGQMSLIGKTLADGSLNISSLNSGIYFIHILNGDNIIAKQFIKE